MLIVPAILETHRSLKDKTIKLTFETSELSPEQLIEVSKHLQKFGFLAFKEDVFKQTEIDLLESLKSDFEDTGKSKAQRLRAVLYKNFEQEPLRYEVFDDYYNYHLEKLIDHFKNKLQ